MLGHYLKKELVYMKTVHCGEICSLCFELMFVLLGAFVDGEMRIHVHVIEWLAHHAL